MKLALNSLADQRAYDSNLISWSSRCKSLTPPRGDAISGGSGDPDSRERGDSGSVLCGGDSVVSAAVGRGDRCSTAGAGANELTSSVTSRTSAAPAARANSSTSALAKL